MTTRISGSTRVVATNEHIAAELSGETIVLGLGDGIYYGLPGVGARVWQLVQEERSVLDVRDALVREYDVDPDRCLRDLEKLFADLAGRGLVVTSDLN
jgi:hypothetical protein